MPGRSELHIPPYHPLAKVESRFFAIGSCFALEMKAQLGRHGIHCQESPFGTVYHPLAIAEQLKAICTLDWNPRPVARENYWLDFGAHSQLWASSPSELRIRIEKELSQARQALEQSHYLLITWGSAKGYYKDARICANCHKQPNTEFQTHLSKVEELNKEYSEVLSLLHTHFPKLHVIFSLSPVRHLRDGILVNSVSKSILRTALWALQEKPGVSYFPAYEFLIDDLRDYRYTKADKMHPTEEAVEYIWEKFSQALFDAEALTLMKSFSSLYKNLVHRPQWANTSSWKTRLTTIEQEISRVEGHLEVEELKGMLAQRKHEAGLV